MSHTPEHDSPQARAEERAVSSQNSTGLSLALTVVLFLLFAGGLYVMSLMTPVTFCVGVGMCLLSLFITFTVIPKYLT